MFFIYYESSQVLELLLSFYNDLGTFKAAD